ncbi:hypothetical protein M3936_22675 [Sutcliffiella horikoshii]|uniref:hypothetical protein n=1 Tax=Sutcliffiella horikoshii TaxID=79883 RepID=UPI0007D07F85|nr:hypothetical protein [Sutcliffiella horikoshii]MCM3620365.1 hypothetical protein [Sutcliffiella horikoshii]
MNIKIPAYLHEVFGERQNILQLAAIFFFGVIFTSILYIYYSNNSYEVASWRKILAFLIIFDILCGCIANFTKSTSNYYAKDKKKQIIFILIHVHLLFVGFLLGTSSLAVTLVWIYTVICSFIVISIKGANQIFVAGLLLCIGIGVTPMLGMESYMLIISMLFMIKVVFSFSVDHYQNRIS